MKILTDGEIDAHIGGQLRTLRRHRKFSLDQLAEAIDVSYQQIQKYQNGISRMSGSKLYRASLALDAPVTAFFNGLPVPVTPDPFTLTRDELEIVALLRANRGIFPSWKFRELVVLLTR